MALQKRRKQCWLISPSLPGSSSWPPQRQLAVASGSYLLASELLQPVQACCVGNGDVAVLSGWPLLPNRRCGDRDLLRPTPTAKRSLKGIRGRYRNPASGQIAR
ncbi:hypothetical protein KIF59_21075 [Enterobacter cloacae subsp. cloacae]|nr:hypothetical protein [Enterobacter cloacae subsp. cloacae]